MENDVLLKEEKSMFKQMMEKFTFFSTFLSIIAAVLTALGVVYGFYYETNSVIEQHTQQLKEESKKINILNEKFQKQELYQAAEKEKINAIFEKVNTFETHQTRMEDKLDKLIFELKKK